MRIRFPLIRRRYSLTITKGYCGAIMTAKKPLKGETWLRGCDLRDGNLSCFPKVLWDIFCCELKMGRHSRKNNPTRPCNGSSAGWGTPTATFLILLLLTSCQLATHESHASATKWEKDTLISVGGTTHTTGADGFDNATDHNASFQVAVQAGGAGYAVGQTSKATINAANNKTAQKLNASNAQTTQLKNASDATTAQGKTAASAGEFDTAVKGGAVPTVGTVPAIQP